MPSPFPGMDPYLEAPTEWPGLHELLIASSVAALQPALNDRGYYANPGERVWVTEPDRSIYPDLALIRAPEILPTQSTTSVLADPPTRVRNGLVQIREPFIDIHESATDQVITGIEFLSPWNKCTRTGRSLYRRKQRECDRHRINLVEIDLLRRGRHVALVPPIVLRHHRPFTYLANIERVGTAEYEFYPISLRNRLPRIVIPLKSSDADAVLDLQAAFTQAYDAGPWRLRIKYRNSPSPPLAEDDGIWADQLLKDQGLR